MRGEANRSFRDGYSSSTISWPLSSTQEYWHYQCGTIEGIQQVHKRNLAPEFGHGFIQFLPNQMHMETKPSYGTLIQTQSLMEY